MLSAEEIATKIYNIYGQSSLLVANNLVADLKYTHMYTQEDIAIAIEKLNKQVPLQYVTGLAYFLNLILHVNEAVLIPRPETEELVVTVMDLVKMHNVSTVLDIGTGSGCIALAIKSLDPSLSLAALDVSQAALVVAAKNASKYNLDVAWCQANILDESLWAALPQADIIVSNPPYISHAEKQHMSANVLDYEPHLALFAGDDPLIFYKAIAHFAIVKKSKLVVCELNEFLAQDTASIFKSLHFRSVEIKKDLQGKDRILVASI